MDSDEQLTRRQRRERARTERRAAEQAAATDAAKRKRLAQLGAVVTVAVGAIVAILILAGGGGRAPSGGGPREVAAVSGLLAGIAQRGTVLGSPTATVTMQYFGDLECSACQEFTLGALPSIVRRWVRSGKLRIEYRSLETATREPETFRTQQVAMLAAGEQDRAWEFIELFYREQGEEDSGYVTESYLRGLATQVPGLDLATWTTGRGDQALSARLTADAQAAKINGVASTPGFLIGRTGGTLQSYEYTSLTDPSGFDAAIERAAVPG